MWRREGGPPGRPGAVAVLWDLDGTLVDSAGDIAANVNRALRDAGLPELPEARVRGFVGDGARSLVQRCAEAAGGRFDPTLLSSFLAHYLAHPAERSRVHPPELRGLLDTFAEEGVPMAVVTNKPLAVSLALLDALALRDHFGVVVGGDSFPERKPHPRPLREATAALGVERAVMVGDGPQDVAAARAAGLPVVGVGWGIAAPDGADLTVTDVPGLADRLRSIIMRTCVSSS